MKSLQTILDEMQNLDHVPAVREVVALGGSYADIRANADSIRTKLFNILNTSAFVRVNCKDGNLHDLADNFLIIIAQLTPINDVDPITLDEIEDKYRIYLTSGHQVDLRNVVRFYEEHTPKSELNETPGNRYVLHPITTTVLPKRDFLRIQEAANQLLGKEIKPFDKKYVEPSSSAAIPDINELLRQFGQFADNLTRTTEEFRQATEAFYNTINNHNS